MNDWALANGFPAWVVYALLAGRTKGLRGEAHRAAVALGLKVGMERGPLPLRSDDQASMEADMK